MTQCGRVQTGVYIGNDGYSSCPPADTPVIRTPGKTILFSPESAYDNYYSPSFTLTPGSVALIDGYNMPEEDQYYITVDRLVKSTKALPVGGNNCNPCDMKRAFGSGDITLFRETMSLGGNEWRLTKKHPQLLITIPGIYDLRLSSLDMIGDMEVELMMWEQPRVHYPESYFAGLYQG